MYFPPFHVLGALGLSCLTGTINSYDTTTSDPQTISSIVLIKNIISLKNLVTATGELNVLPQLVTEDVVVQIFAPTYNASISGLTNLTDYIRKNDGPNLLTHDSSSQFVELLTPKTARALSATQENYFGKGKLENQVASYFERQEDQLRFEKGAWKIFKTIYRTVAGPIGNPDVIISPP